MNFDIFDRRRAERFAQLLDETNGGLRRHAREQADGQLAELVAIGHSLSAVRPVAQVDVEFRTGLRAMLVATAERDGIGEPAGAASATAGPAAVGAGHAMHAAAGSRRPLLGRRVRARGAIVIGVAAGALAVSGISAASENAVPGDALYGVKRSTERAQLAMAGSDVTRGQLSLDFARTRLAEAIALDGGDRAFGAVLDDMDADTRQGVRLLHTSAMARRDTAPLDTVETFVVGQRRLLTPVLDELSSGNRTRALVSMSLFDDVDSRGDALRTSLNCGTSGGDAPGADSLGPEPKPCWVGSNATDPNAPAGQQQGAGGVIEAPGVTTGHAPAKPKPAISGSVVEPTATAPAAPAGKTSATPDVASTIRKLAPSTSPTPDAVTTDTDTAPAEDGGVLHDIIGILGG